MDFSKTTVLAATNESLSDPLTWEEFVCFMGIVFLLATIQGVSRRMFWANNSPDIFDAADAPFCLHAYMSRQRFESILKHLKFTYEEAPPYKHPFHPVNKLIASFNEEHTQCCFYPGWINCLDESMSVWTNMWTCPGWMFRLRKPHPMGNEYYSLCRGVSGIMYAIELVEGKDCSRQLQPPNILNLESQLHIRVEW